MCCKCHKPFSFYYDGKYWCAGCGEHAQLIKLIEQLYLHFQVMLVHPKDIAIAKQTSNEILSLARDIQSLSQKVETMFQIMQTENYRR